jgi:hypothetical protein
MIGKSSWDEFVNFVTLNSQPSTLSQSCLSAVMKATSGEVNVNDATSTSLISIRTLYQLDYMACAYRLWKFAVLSNIVFINARVSMCKALREDENIYYKISHSLAIVLFSIVTRLREKDTFWSRTDFPYHKSLFSPPPPLLETK